jgi:hypothetical protein
MKDSTHDSTPPLLSSSNSNFHFMSREEIARNIAVLVVRQHHRFVARDAKKNDSVTL